MKKQILLIAWCISALTSALYASGTLQPALSPFSEEVSGCQIIGEPRTICDWRSDVQTVLSTCFTQSPGANCQWWQGSHVYINGPASIISGTGEFPASTMNNFVQAIANNAQSYPPGDDYRVFSYTVQTITGSNGECWLQIIPVYRRISCQAPPSNG